MSPPSVRLRWFYRYDGEQPVPITRRELNAWIVRARVGAAQFRYAAERGDLEGMQAWSEEAAGCGAELQNIAAATAAHEQGETT